MAEKKRFKNVGDTQEQKVTTADGETKTITSKIIGVPGKPALVEAPTPKK